MNAATLDTYMNLILFVAIFGGAAYGLYRLSRTKKPQVREVPKRPGEHKRRVRQEEADGYPEEWEVSPVVNPVQPRVQANKPKPPTFRQTISKGHASSEKGRNVIKPASMHRRDDVDVTIPVIIASEQPRCDPEPPRDSTPSYSSDSSSSDSGGSCSVD